MKKNMLKFSIAAALTLILIAANDALAHTAVESTTTTTSTTGTTSQRRPETIVVRTEASQGPRRYTYTKSTTYVDEAGNPVSVEMVKSGLPVTVYYTREGDRMVATKVIVKKVVKTVPSSSSSVEEHKSST